MSEANAENADIRAMVKNAISSAEKILSLPELEEYDSTDILAKKQRLIELKNTVWKRWNNELIPLIKTVSDSQAQIDATEAAIEEQKNALPEEVLQKNDELMRQITSLRIEIANFEKKISTIQQEIVQLKSQFDTALRDSEELRLSLERKEAEKISLQGVLERLNREFSDLSKEVNSMKTSAEIMQTNQILSEKIEKIRAEHERLLERLSSEAKQRTPGMFEQDELDCLISE